LDCPCSSSSSSSELEITNDVSFIEDFENRIKSIEDNSQNYLLKGLYEEQIQTYLPTVPKTLSVWLPGGSSANLPNTLFRYYDAGVYVYTKTEPIIPMLEINKGSKYIQIGDYWNNHPKTELYVGCNKLRIKTELNEISMELGNIRFNFNYNQTQISIGNGENNIIINHGYQFLFDENRDFLIKRSKI
jgi:hypothetical protein